MKKRDVNDKAVVEKKVTLKEIKKNPDTDVLHSIKRVKSEERKLVLMISSIILVVFLACSFLIFTSITKYDRNNNGDGPLSVRYVNDEDGMSDVVNFVSNNTGMYAFKTEFTISNNRGNSSWYAIYLDDYIDMIEYDNCFDDLIDKNKIYFSIDGSDALSLADIYDDGRYILRQGIISGNDEVVHIVQVWCSEEVSGHYHGKIDIEYIR